MTEADANAMLGDLLMHLANPKGARALFEHAVTLDGHSHWRSPDWRR